MRCAGHNTTQKTAYQPVLQFFRFKLTFPEWLWTVPQFFLMFYFTRIFRHRCTKGRREWWLVNKLAPALQFYLALLIISLILNSTVIRTPHGMPGQMQGLGCCFTGWAYCQICSTYFPGSLGQLQATTPEFTLLLWTAKLLLTIDPGSIYSHFSLIHSNITYLATLQVGYDKLLAVVQHKQKEKDCHVLSRGLLFTLKKERVYS